jgi:hypothetical protein
MAEKEKPFNIRSWDDLREALATMKPRTKLFLMVETEMKRRGHWRKRRPRTGE